jgi:hypothetical protein
MRKSHALLMAIIYFLGLQAYSRVMYGQSFGASTIVGAMTVYMYKHKGGSAQDSKSQNANIETASPRFEVATSSSDLGHLAKIKRRRRRLTHFDVVKSDLHFEPISYRAQCSSDYSRNAAWARLDPPTPPPV